jgi:diaminohydroxyphosphoribosylaminopyrimidine deaminase/5-amino-6-(5-phosphoribosylamino)uracil reductase
MEVDEYYMARAVQLGQRGQYTTSPNPRVGCVIVRDGRIVGKGWHMFAGEPHAEVHALQQAGARAKAATAYVTLEPCAHHGRTPPCSAALIEAGIGRVVIGMQDPNPLVAGKGVEQLRAAGIDVTSGVCEAQVEALNPGFSRRMRTGRPYVRCKLAMSLDGRTAMASGESKWITSAQARRDVHLLRARSDAIVTGIATVLADDPSMTVRLEAEAKGQPLHEEIARARQRREPPLRVVLDSALQIPASAQILRAAGKCLVVTATTQAAVQNMDAEVVSLPGSDARVDLVAMLELLANCEINEVLVEAGATLAGSMLAQQLVDELVIYMAPVLMGDAGRGLVHLPGLTSMADRVELAITNVTAVGSDWRITARPVYKQ